MEEYIEVGKIKKVHGLNGELKISLLEHLLDSSAQADAFFVDQKGNKTPYFIESLRGSEDYLLKFEEIDSKEAASPFAHKPLFMRRIDIDLPDEVVLSNGLVYGYLEGYQLVEQDLGLIGEILFVDAFPQQEMATVSYQEKEVFVPLLPAWIQSIDKEKRTVEISLPEGLLDV